MQKPSLKKLLTLAVGITLGFISMQIPFSQLVGAKGLRFSMFDFYGPIAGAFLGSLPGLLTVAAMQISNWAYHGFATDIGTLIRFLPMLAAVLYFAKKTAWTLCIPAVAMLAFWAHPEGRAAWYYALYWIIPCIAYFFHKRFLFARALGAAFMAHSVGGALWIWAFNMKAAVWIGLIPVVWKERMLMALGISISYILINYLLSVIEKKTGARLSFISINPKYAVKKT